jgi:drug/metabolite transporter (DMT)-like permease
MSQGGAATGMTRRGLVLFGAMAVIWGIPYLLIKVALEDLTPGFLVFARTAVAALVLLPVALRRGILRPALAHWRPVLAFAAIEIALPWLLLGDAERHLSSSLAGLLVATVPLIGTLIAWRLGDASAVTGTRLLGLVVGMLGVAAVVGLDLGTGTSVLAVVEILGVAVCYATGPVIAARRLTDVPPLAVISVSLTAVALAYVPIGIASHPHALPTGRVLLAVLALALVCTATAFLLFFALIAEIGPVRATVITFVNPAVAVALGVGVLGESFTAGIAVGFPLVLLGSWLSTRKPAPAAVAGAPVEAGA